MRMYDQIQEVETLCLLKEWNVDLVDETDRHAFNLVISSVKQILGGKHSKDTDAFIEKCNSAVDYKYETIYWDKGVAFETEMVLQLFKAACIGFEAPLNRLSNYKVHSIPMTFLATLSNQVKEIQKTRNILVRDRLQKQILEELDIESLVELEDYKNVAFKQLCNVYFSEKQSSFILNYLKNKRLNKFIRDLFPDEKIKKEWFLKMSVIIIDKYLGNDWVLHKNLLKELKTVYFHSDKKSGQSLNLSYASSLFQELSVQDLFDEYELDLFFEGDLTLDLVKQKTDLLITERTLKRSSVSEYIFNQMKLCSDNTNCKFNCKYDFCKYRALLELLGSHLSQYDVLRIDEKMGEEIQPDFLFVIDEMEEELTLVLCSSSPHSSTSIFLFNVLKRQLTDVWFLLLRYFESDYEWKRKNLLKNMLRYGRYFGILSSRVYRK